MADTSFNISCKELKIAQIPQLNQLFQLFHLVHIYGHGFSELRWRRQTFAYSRGVLAMMAYTLSLQPKKSFFQASGKWKGRVFLAEVHMNG